MSMKWHIGTCLGALLIFALIAPFPSYAVESKTPLAVVNGREITEADITTSTDSQLLRLQQQIYTARKQAIDLMITEQLLSDEAKKRGISQEQLLQQEVKDKTPAVTDAEVEQWYNQNKSRLGNKSLDELKTQIATQLNNQRQQQQQQEFVRNLRKAAGVKVLIKPPPTSFTLAGAPVRGPTNAPVTIVEFSDYQ